MKTKNLILIAAMAFISSAIIITSGCSGEKKEAAENGTETPTAETAPVANPNGVGEITHVELTTPLNEDMIKRGNGVFDMKCSACHKLTADRLVGPGWAGVTARRTPEWIMNMITNTDVMLDKDPEAQKMLETCLVRMPNQGLTVADARDIVEFMRKNDDQK